MEGILPMIDDLIIFYVLYAFYARAGIQLPHGEMINI